MTALARAPRRPKWGRLAQGLVLAVMSAAVLVPVYFVVVTAFKTQAEYRENKLGLPVLPVLENLLDVVTSSGLPTWLLNSLLLTVASVGLTTVCAIPAAYAFARMRFRGRRLLFDLSTTLMFIPSIVLVIPLYVAASQLGLLNSFATVVVIYTGLMLPFSIYLLASFFVTLPRDLTDAAVIDGATTTQAVVHVVVPLAAPALVTQAVVNAYTVWNELLIALIFLQSDTQRTLMVGITGFKNLNQVNIPLVIAGLALASLPIVALYVAGQRVFVQGLTAGAVHGE